MLHPNYVCRDVGQLSYRGVLQLLALAWTVQYILPFTAKLQTKTSNKTNDCVVTHINRYTLLNKLNENICFS